MKRNRINIRVSDDFWDKLTVEAGAHGATMTAIIETALEQYFDPSRVDERETQLLSRMDRYDARQERMEMDLRLCAESIGQFILYWLTHMEPIPEAEREVANALGRHRYDRFIKQVALRLAGRESRTTSKAD